ncbi:3-isopropylmalate dehydratase large subunit [Pseudooceanicola nanhaiensis]|uniref:3-isopropylmalate dehydratase large subunit n=1 Tax=Pseudooceanicola nanhaiensis TaxID=375761 RepID=UPI001CD792AE|nr:aconitase/3-isopropylmalate dehydratase large subunit family protein [Pseudooceanicola nanhaiensis]MCA0918778.1 3-isopropylmalate dehydratase large subunit [Pseudooceanicola nanhaiensis]
MGQTIIEKILARAAGRDSVTPGDIVDVAVDLAVLIDTNFYPAAWREVLKVAAPEKVAVIFDHRTPAPDNRAAEAHRVGRAFVETYGIERVHDVGRDMGIAHAVIAERGYGLPGSVLVCDDSHTCAAGAFNCAAMGVGEPDMIQSVTTGRTWFRVAPTIRYELTGILPEGVAAKDLFLWIAGLYGAHTGHNIEVGGPGLASLGMDARRTFATMAAELGSDFCTFEADQRLLDFMRARTDRPFTPQSPDPDATYAELRRIDLGAVRPRVALPHSILGNTASLQEAVGEPIQQAFIGSCANGTLDDLRMAAEVLEGRLVAPGVRLIVTPSSQAVYREALRLGYIATLMEAGAVVTNATCGACCGAHMGLLSAGETCITSSTRNFRGRMGDPSARIFMASSAVVAASAVAGRIAGVPVPNAEATA